MWRHQIGRAPRASAVTVAHREGSILKLRKPIASLVSVVLLSIGMATMATSTASANTNTWPSHGNDWSRSGGQNTRGDDTGPQHVSTPSGYVVVAWYMPGWKDSSTAVWTPGGQTLATSIKVSSRNLDALDSWATSQSYGCFQIDGYNDNATTTALLAGGHLYGPSNPTESLWGGTAWKFMKVGSCTPPPVNTTVTPGVPTVAPATCQVGDGGVSDVTGGSITLPTTSGVTYTVSGGKTTGLAAGDYTVTATPAGGKSLSVTGTGWTLHDGTATITVTVKAASDCSVTQPAAKVTTTAWVDGTWGCDATTVAQTRTVTTTPYTWGDGQWVLDTAKTTTVTETQTRTLSSSEETVCPSGTLPIPAGPVVVPPTCTADGSATLVNGTDYTWDTTSFGPGTWTATATPTTGHTFDKSGSTYQVTFTVAAKLTGAACTISDVLAAPPNSTVTPAPFSEVLAAAPNASVLAATGASPLPLAIIALVLLAAGALSQPRVRRAIFARH